MTQVLKTEQFQNVRNTVQVQNVKMVTILTKFNMGGLQYRLMIDAFLILNKNK